MDYMNPFEGWKKMKRMFCNPNRKWNHIEYPSPKWDLMVGIIKLLKWWHKNTYVSDKLFRNSNVRPRHHLEEDAKNQ